MRGAYSLYGLNVRCNRILASLIGLECDGAVDLEVEFVETLDGKAFEDEAKFFVSPLLDAIGRPIAVASRSVGNGDIKVVFSDDTTVILSASADRVWVRAPADQTTEDTSAYLLGPIMGAVLRLRGILCLHASVVVIDGKAVALTGPSGAGKSTTAAAFARLGYSVLTDDVLALTDLEGHFLARPAYPRVRLWPQSVEGLFGSKDSLPVMTPNWDKRYLSLRNPGYSFQDAPLPLAAVYFLRSRVTGERAGASIEHIAPNRAVLELLAECYGGNYVYPLSRANEFDALTRLVKSATLRSAKASDGFERIDSFCEAIAEDFRCSLSLPSKRRDGSFEQMN